jgi:hypothetical protein
VTRYFFNYRAGGQYFADTEGTLLLDLAAARTEGRLSAREMLGHDRAELDPLFLVGTYEITDAEGGDVLAVIHFDESRPS